MRAPTLSWESFDDEEVPPPMPRPARIEEFRAPPLQNFSREDPEAPPEPTPAEKAAAARRAQEEAQAAALARARGEGRAEGFEEGAAAAEASFLAERRMILSDIRERLADLELLQARRESETAQALRALAESLIAASAPALARAGLAAEVAEAVAAAHEAGRRERAAPRLSVAVPPAQLQAVRETLADAGLEAELAADERLESLQAEVFWGDGVDAIDLGACIEAASHAIAAHFEVTEEVRAHG